MSAFPAWRAVLEVALNRHRELPSARYVQVATVRADGLPANRTLVFRSFFDPGNRLVFTTDLRSDKITQLGVNPGVELCWYFSSSREQFRIAGRATIIAGKGEAEALQMRLRTWRQLSDGSRQAFSWPRPKEPRAGIDEFQRLVPDEPPPHFALLIVAPQRVDHLDLSTGPHQRTVHRLTGENEWTSTAFNP